ncbi:DUF624 domain-containing protein [Mesobacillus maritimus]|uniref:YesL family protein n=1 Tax=Mesobacillus maritimus TaxID=1643336 RepID=UPI0020407CD0|nr:DUF624 domain-containing protein [Mesobacillus maritimus]MCM3585326.1 DUF624 domain-containing protein [Mesobacillus maritimus]
MNSFVNGLYVTSEWIMRFAVINLLWLAVNLPLVLFVFLFVKSNALLFALPIVLLMPVLFFPATAAVFSSVRDWILEQEGSSLLRSYFRYFKANYKKSFLAGWVFAALWLVLIADYLYLREESPVLALVFIIFGTLLYALTINFFSVNAHYEMNLRALLKRALLLTFGSPVLLLAVIISGVILMYVSIRGPLFLLVFFTGSLTAFLSFSAFYRLYLKITKPEK